MDVSISEEKITFVGSFPGAILSEDDVEIDQSVCERTVKHSEVFKVRNSKRPNFTERDACQIKKDEDSGPYLRTDISNNNTSREIAVKYPGVRFLCEI